MVPYFQLLLVAGVLYPIQTINIQILSALGKMKLNFALSMIKNSLRLLNVVITYKYGVMYKSNMKIVFITKLKLPDSEILFDSK